MLHRVSINGYRAVRDLAFAPGKVCALVGEASSGKSTVLTAVWTLLEAAAPPPTIDDVSRGMSGRIHLEAELDRGHVIFLDARPPASAHFSRPSLSPAPPSSMDALWSAVSPYSRVSPPSGSLP